MELFCHESRYMRESRNAGYSLTDVTFSQLFRWPIVPIVRTADVESDVECYRLSTQKAKCGDLIMNTTISKLRNYAHSLRKWLSVLSIWHRVIVLCLLLIILLIENYIPITRNALSIEVVGRRANNVLLNYYHIQSKPETMIVGPQGNRRTA